jgi:hypothetical protein
MEMLGSDAERYMIGTVEEVEVEVATGAVGCASGVEPKLTAFRCPEKTHVNER